jgi:hypothetical protein
MREDNRQVNTIFRLNAFWVIKQINSNFVDSIFPIDASARIDESGFLTQSGQSASQRFYNFPYIYARQQIRRR